MKESRPRRSKTISEEKAPTEDVQMPLAGRGVPGAGIDNPEIEAQSRERGPECPTCGDRFPSRESLDQHLASEHKG
jgi:hypothetical protein